MKLTFSLNHDLLLERILELNEIEFSKGFNILNSNIFYEKIHYLSLIIILTKNKNI